MRRILVGTGPATWVALVALLLWAVLAWPIATGERSFVLRDVVMSHLPLKSFGAAQLAEGRIPAIVPSWASGQPFRGNPNALPFYPGNLLYLALPFWSAFGLHYVLHWLLAFLGARRLALRLGQGPEAALLVGFAYAGSGYLLTTLTFMNLLTVAAWAPWVLAGLAGDDRRGPLLSGLACGMMLLGGEPLASALVVPLMALVAIPARGVRAGILAAATSGVVGLLTAAPQLVATARVLPWSYRAAHGLPVAQAAANDLHPARLLELALPLPWGWPSDLRRFSYWAPDVTPWVPYVFSLHVGLVATILALAAARRRSGWAAIAGLSLLGAWALGLDAQVTHALTLGLFRYPQKLLFPFTLAVAVLAGFGVERVLSKKGRARAWWIASAAVGVVALVFFARPDWLAGPLRSLARDGSPVLARTQAGHWTMLLFAAALTLAGAAWAVRRRSAAGLAVVELVALLQMAPAWVTIPTARLAARPTLLDAIGDPPRVAQLVGAFPPWETPSPYAPEAHDPVAQALLQHADLEPQFGPLDGLDHPMAPDLEGLTSPLTVFVHRNLAIADWPARLAWLRRLGVAWVVRHSPDPGPPLEVVAREERYGVTTEVDRLPGFRPHLDWPAAVRVTASPIDGWLAVQRGLADDVTVVSAPVDHHPGGRVRQLVETPDRLEAEVDSEGGLLVWRRAYWPFYRARTASGEELRTQVVDVALLGVEVPPGRQRVIVDVSATPEWIAGLVALLAVAGVVWRIRPCV